MRFCPFCAKEIQGDVTHCGHCGKRLPAGHTPLAPAAEGASASKTIMGYMAPKFDAEGNLQEGDPAWPDLQGGPPGSAKAETPAPLAEVAPGSAPKEEAHPPLTRDTIPEIPELEEMPELALVDLEPTKTTVDGAPPSMNMPDLDLALVGDDGPTGEDLDFQPYHTPTDDEPLALQDSFEPAKTLVDNQFAGAEVLPPTPAPPPAPEAPPPPAPEAPSAQPRDLDSLPPPTPETPPIPEAPPIPAPTAPEAHPPAPPQQHEASPAPLPPVEQPAPAPGKRITAPEMMARLEPMPAEVPTGFIGGLPYFYKVLSARMKRGGVISAFNREIEIAQKMMNEEWRELGEKAWDMNFTHPSLKEAVDTLKKLEEQRSSLDSSTKELDQRLKQEEKSYQKLEEQLKKRIDLAQQDVDALQNDLNEKNAELRTVKARLAEEQKSHKALASDREIKEKQALKAKDPEQGNLLEQQASELQPQIRELEEQLETTKAEVEALDAPIAELTAKLTEATGELQEARKEFAAAQQAYGGIKRELAAEERKQGLEQKSLDRARSQRLMEMGKALEEERVSHFDFDPYYLGIKDIRLDIEDREKSIQLLETERESYDKQAYKNGIILLGAIAGGILLIFILLGILVG